MAVRLLENGRFLSSLLYRSHVARTPHGVSPFRAAGTRLRSGSEDAGKRGRPQAAPSTLTQTGRKRSESHERASNDGVERIEANGIVVGAGDIAVGVTVHHVEVQRSRLDVLDHAGTDEVEAGAGK